MEKMGGGRTTNRTQLIIFLTVVCALTYTIFSSKQANNELSLKLASLSAKAKTYESESKDLQKKYDTSHANEETYKTSNEKLKQGLEKSEKNLADANTKLSDVTSKFKDAHEFYNDIKTVIGMHSHSGDDKTVDKRVAKTMKEQISDMKKNLINSNAASKNNSLLRSHYDVMKSSLNITSAKVSLLLQSNAKLMKENHKLKKGYDSLKERHAELISEYQKLSQKLVAKKTSDVITKARKGSAVESNEVESDSEVASGSKNISESTIETGETNSTMAEENGNESGNATMSNILNLFESGSANGTSADLTSDNTTIEEDDATQKSLLTANTAKSKEAEDKINSLLNPLALDSMSKSKSNIKSLNGIEGKSGASTGGKLKSLGNVKAASKKVLSTKLDKKAAGIKKAKADPPVNAFVKLKQKYQKKESTLDEETIKSSKVKELEKDDDEDGLVAKDGRKKHNGPPLVALE